MCSGGRCACTTLATGSAEPLRRRFSSFESDDDADESRVRCSAGLDADRSSAKDDCDGVGEAAIGSAGTGSVEFELAFVCCTPASVSSKAVANGSRVGDEWIRSGEGRSSGERCGGELRGLGSECDGGGSGIDTGIVQSNTYGVRWSVNTCYRSGAGGISSRSEARDRSTHGHVVVVVVVAAALRARDTASVPELNEDLARLALASWAQLTLRHDLADGGNPARTTAGRHGRAARFGARRARHGPRLEPGRLWSGAAGHEREVRRRGGKRQRRGRRGVDIWRVVRRAALATEALLTTRALEDLAVGRGRLAEAARAGRARVGRRRGASGSGGGARNGLASRLRGGDGSCEVPWLRNGVLAGCKRRLARRGAVAWWGMQPGRRRQFHRDHDGGGVDSRTGGRVRCKWWPIESSDEQSLSG